MNLTLSGLTALLLLDLTVAAHAAVPDVVESDAAGNTAMGTDVLGQVILTTSPFGGGPIGPAGNTGAGESALLSDVAGSHNSAFGSGALQSNSIGNFNTAIGHYALLSASALDNVTAVGAFALRSVTTGTGNSAFGANALLNLTSGSNSTAVGYNALQLSTASGNTAVGSGSLGATTTGNNETGVGYGALQQNTTGNDNTAVGVNAQRNSQTGSLNTALGYSACWACRSGERNTALGSKALYSNQTGSSNVALGSAAGYNTTGSNNIVIGNEGFPQESGAIRIGAEGVQTAAYIAGIGSTQVTGAAVYVNSDGRLGVLASSERYKTNVVPMQDATRRLLSLRPVRFHLKNDHDAPVQYGLIAEEVNAVYPELVIRDSAGTIQGVRYDELAPMLLNEVQRLERRDREYAREIADLKRENRQIITALNHERGADHPVASR